MSLTERCTCGDARAAHPDEGRCTAWTSNGGNPPHRCRCDRFTPPTHSHNPGVVSLLAGCPACAAMVAAYQVDAARQYRYYAPPDAPMNPLPWPGEPLDPEEAIRP